MFIDKTLDILEHVVRLLRFREPLNIALNRHYRKLLKEGGVAQTCLSDIALPDRPQGNPKVSIIILTLNRAHLLDALFSSFAQHNTWDNFEILVVNHGTDTATQTCLDSWSNRLPIQEIRLLKNFSFAFSCNRAAEVAQGDVLLFLNNDVVISEDFLPRMCGAVMGHSGGGLIGMKLFHLTRNKEPGEHHHIGIRLQWRVRKAWAQPYNATPSFADDTVKNAPALMPAVTAAVAGCRRNDFLSIGGFHEGYVYGYEDIDLCYKLRLRNHASIISLNNVSALHDEGETRSKKAPSQRRRAWLRNNTSTLRNRFGYIMRRDAYAQLFTGTGWGRQTVVGLGGKRKTSIRADLLKNFAMAVTTHNPTLAGYNAFGLDLLLALSPTFDMNRLRHAHPAMLSIACISDHGDDWSTKQLDTFDILTASHQQLAETLQARHGRPVVVLNLADDDLEDALRALLIHFTSTRHKISIKSANTHWRWAKDIQQTLQSEGHKVRIDQPSDWMTPQRLRDDVVLWGAMPNDHEIQEGSINIALFRPAKNTSATFDAVIALDQDASETALSNLSEAIEGAHIRRTQAPTDHPLTDHRATKKELKSIWLETPDPVDRLLKM